MQGAGGGEGGSSACVYPPPSPGRTGLLLGHGSEVHSWCGFESTSRVLSPAPPPGPGGCHAPIGACQGQSQALLSPPPEGAPGPQGGSSTCSRQLTPTFRKPRTPLSAGRAQGGPQGPRRSPGMEEESPLHAPLSWTEKGHGCGGGR